MTLFETAALGSLAFIALILAYRGIASSRRPSGRQSKTQEPAPPITVVEEGPASSEPPGKTEPSAREPAPTPVPEPPPRPTVPPRVSDALATEPPPPLEIDVEHDAAAPPPVDVSPEPAPLEPTPPPSAASTPTAPAPASAPVDRAAIEAANPEQKKARTLARLFVSEIKLYNEKAVAEGSRAGDLYTRLKEPIDQALALFDRRVPEAVRADFDYMYDEIVRQLAGGDATKLGSVRWRRR